MVFRDSTVSTVFPDESATYPSFSHLLNKKLEFAAEGRLVRDNKLVTFSGTVFLNARRRMATIGGYAICAASNLVVE